MTHDDMIVSAIRHLRTTQRCRIVLWECGANGEIVDVIGWAWRGNSVMIECKTSMADYYVDAKKPRTANPEGGMGQRRWYLTPKGMLRPGQLRPSWGLMEMWGSRVRRVVQAPTRETWDWRSEQQVLSTDLQAWHEALASYGLDAHGWGRKGRIICNAATCEEHNEQCPKCGTPMWEWNKLAREKEIKPCPTD